MYEYLSGEFSFPTTSTVVVDCGGVGYKCSISQNTYKKISSTEKGKIYTFLNVKEDALDLYGFSDSYERAMFLLLIDVNGVGPKAGLAILSELTPDQVINAVILGDFLTFKSVSGIGPKIAERICLELKKPVQKLGFSTTTENFSSAESNEIEDAIEILVGFGYTRPEAKKVVLKCTAENTQDIVRQAMTMLG